MLLTRHPWLDTYWQERVKNPFVDFVWYRRFTLQISGLLSRASVRFLIFIKYEKNRCVRSLGVVEVLIGLAFRSATSCCLPTGRLRSLTAASVPPFPPFGRRSLRFESALANIYCFKIKKLSLLREYLFLEIIGFAFRSATSCCLPTGRLRSLTVASLPPFPPFGRRSLRFES